MAHPIEFQSMHPIEDSPVKLRSDLQFVPIQRGLGVAYVIRDPVNLKFYEFEDHELALLLELGTGKGWNELCQWFNHRFPPLRLSQSSLRAMVWRLFQQGLLVSVTAGQGRKAADRTIQNERREWTQRLFRPWVVRVPGINPGPLLGIANGLIGWIFSPLFVGIASICLAVLAAIVLSHYDAIMRMTPASVDFFSRQNVLLFAATIAVTKLLHELGHAIAAYRLNCECHEMGILLLGGIPSLYCDVSDAWSLPNRWHRIAISLAGIWVELLLSAIAFVVWALSVDGLVHAISFNLMVVCSVATVLFNANPLVRYDGYYVLMDLAGVSNLGQRSDEAVNSFLTRWILGSREIRSLDAPAIPIWCLPYGLASAFYRVFLTWMILWGMHTALKPFSMSIFLWIYASVALASWSFTMLTSSTHQFRRAVAAETPVWRVLFGSLCVCGILLSLVSFPLPWHVFGDAVLEPADVQSLVTTVPGNLKYGNPAGTTVIAGDLIACIENQDIDRDIAKLEHETRSQREHLQSLLARRNQDQRAAEQIPGAQASVVAVEHRLNHLIDEKRRMEFRAGKQVVIFPAPPVFDRHEEGELANWTGTLLDASNQNAWCNAGDVYCQIGSRDCLDAVAVLAQDDLESVTVGQSAEILLKSSSRIYRGEVVRISNLELDSRDESTLRMLLPEGTHQGSPGKWYQVQIRCHSELPVGTPVRSRCRIRISVGSRTIGQWLVLQFFKTLRWRL